MQVQNLACAEAPGVFPPASCTDKLSPRQLLREGSRNRLRRALVKSVMSAVYKHIPG